MKIHKPLFYLNYFLLQFLFIRLARVMEDTKQVGWTIIYVLPFTGWNTDYIYWRK
jgi:hypothetical protein